MAPPPNLHLPLVARVETYWPNLNRLLANESLVAGRGFFDATFYGYLKQDRMLSESEGRDAVADKLKTLEGKLENTIGQMMAGG